MIDGNFYITDIVLPIIMEVVSAKVDKTTKQKMQRFPGINWSETIRRAIQSRLEEEELKKRNVDLKEVEEACRITDSIRRQVTGWDSTVEIRKWRDQRRR